MGIERRGEILSEGIIDTWKKRMAFEATKIILNDLYKLQEFCLGWCVKIWFYIGVPYLAIIYYWIAIKTDPYNGVIIGWVFAISAAVIVGTLLIFQVSIFYFCLPLMIPFFIVKETREEVAGIFPIVREWSIEIIKFGEWGVVWFLNLFPDWGEIFFTL